MRMIPISQLRLEQGIPLDKMRDVLMGKYGFTVSQIFSKN